MALVRRDGVDAHAFANWLARAGDADRRALRSLRPGDHLELCVASKAGRAATIDRLRVQSDRAGRRRAGQESRVAGLAGIRASVVTVMLARGSAATGHPLRSQVTVTEPLPPATHLAGALAAVVGRRPVVVALAAYAHQVWHLPATLPKDSHYRLAMLEDPARGAHHRLAMVALEAHGRRWRAYHYVDAHGHDYVVSAHGRGFEVLRPRHPVNHARISSGWGWRIQPVLGGREFHRGIDYAAPLGTPVHAAMDGTVSLCDWHGGYGRVVEIRHAHGLRTRYGHLSRFAARLHPGSHVHRGQVIGYVGSTGLSTGPHLYYEIWEHGVRVNPLHHAPLTVAARLDTHQRKRLRHLIASVQQTS